MNRIAILTIATLLAGPAIAQEQQAGNAASTNTDETFQALIDACDDTDALMLRARIRLQIPRTTPEAGQTAQKMLDEAFATCGSGDLEAAKAQMTEALKIAEAGATENFGTDASAETEAVAAAEPAAGGTQSAAEEASKPWWKFW